MKIAVIDHVGNYGGGSRVVRSLLPAIRKRDPEIQLSFFGNPASIKREGMEEEFNAVGIEVSALQSLRLANLSKLKSKRLSQALGIAQSSLLSRLTMLPSFLTGNVTQEIESISAGFDLAYFPWPFLLSPPELDCPIVSTFHDFNFKYYFGGSFVFSQKQRVQLEQEMPRWLEISTPVVSSKFMASELAAFYPEATARTKIVHLAPLGGVDMIPPSTAFNTVSELGVSPPFILCPTHMCSHKNLGPLLAATSLLIERGIKISLVLTGAGTEAAQGTPSIHGLRLGTIRNEVQGLGYVSHMQMNCLLQCASVVVNPSLYEAGNGPALDAWVRGTPVAMSNIPSFTEHLDVLGVKAQIFNQRDPHDIANKISAILDDPVRARDDAEHSRRAIKFMSWEDTANEYISIFRGLVHQK